ncbi:hypothetical protein M3G15_18755, partial [Paenibacillus sp. p3-SID1389]|uniref:hypothetical protein n=1 Tax=Paenibacillus sp. p3-SID1389 TaxID=2916364 RepID=UPI0021A82AEB
SHVAGYVLKNDFSAEMNYTFTFDRSKIAVFSQNELHFYISWRWWCKKQQLVVQKTSVGGAICAS